MRRILPLAIVLWAAAGVAGCGDKPASGPVGRWELDAARTFAPQLAAVRGNAAAEKELRARMDGLTAGGFVLELKADGTTATSGSMLGSEEAGTGTWVAKGSGALVTPLTRSGKPAEGHSALPYTLDLQDGELVMSPGEGAPPLWLKRK